MRRTINPRSRTEKAKRRQERLRRDQFQRSRVIWVIHRMAAPPHEIEWRVRVVLAPDTRSLTGVLLGDPRYERSMLFFKRMAAS